jgi:hypothetical protein
VAIEGRVPAPPTLATALPRHLVYELHVTNMGLSAVALQRLDVIGGTGDRGGAVGTGNAVLASWSDAQLWQRISVLGRADGPAQGPRLLSPGSRAIVYLWVTVPAGEPAPHELVHRLTFVSEDPTGTTSIAILSARRLSPSSHRSARARGSRFAGRPRLPDTVFRSCP